MKERNKITLEKGAADADRILEICESYGICVIDSFLDDGRVKAIREDIQEVYQNVDNLRGVNTHVNLDYQHALFVHMGVDPDQLPAIMDLTEESQFESVVRQYYQEDDVLFPSNLFIARSIGTEDSPDGVIDDGPPYALHYDRQNKFKFFFYLTDVTIDNGATHFAPGLHHEIKQRRLTELDQGLKRSEMSNTIENVEQDIVPVVGDAGTLLIFDTDVPHHAGGLAEGQEREVLRIDSYSPSHSRMTLVDKLKRTVSTLIR